MPIHFGSYFLTADSILELVSDYQLYSHYVPQFKIGGAIPAPYRNDSNPSFSIFPHRDNGTLLWKDHATGECGNIFSLIKKIFRCNYADALSIVNRDYNLQLIDFNKSNYSSHKPVNKEVKLQTISKSKTEIIVNPSNFTEIDKVYWNKYHLTEEDLNLFKLYSIDSCQINNSVKIKKTEKEPMYAYITDVGVKVYRPLSSVGKWFSTLTKNEVFSFGFPISKDLIITKSLKDVICIHKHLNYSAISFQSESILPEDYILEGYIKNNYGRVFIYYDRDAAGIHHSCLLEEKLNRLIKMPIINITDNDLTIGKDFSDSLAISFDGTIDNLKELLQ